MANGTRTTPAITAAATAFLFSLSWVDANNKDYSNAFLVKSAVTDIELEAIVATAQLASNASCWRAEKTSQWEGARNQSFALSAVHESVADKIRYSLKNLATRAYTKAYIPAPLNELVQTNNQVDTTNLIYSNWKSAVDTAVMAGFIALNVEFVQYTQRNDVTSP